jgi:hypothetical protein
MEKLVLAVQSYPVRPSTREDWDRVPALKVIDCVLSLNRPYDKFVAPRVVQFKKAYPNVLSVSDLQALIRSFSSPDAFVRETLDYKHAERAVMLSKVVDWLAVIAGTGDLQSQQYRLEAWAKEARFQGADNPRIRDFGLAGFQYMRMLFGADTTKPDTWIIQWVATQVGRKVSDRRALHLLESAARHAGVSVRDLDTTIWEASTGKSALTIRSLESSPVRSSRMSMQQRAQGNTMQVMLKLVKPLESILQYVEKKEPKTLEEAKAMMALISVICSEALIEHTAAVPKIKRSPYPAEFIEKFDRHTAEVKAQALAIRAASIKASG